MRIVRLRRQTELWGELFLEDGTRLRCPLPVILESGLTSGQEVSAETLSELHRQSQLWQIRHTALRLLARRAHTREELRRKLVRKFPAASAVIETVLERLAAEGYLDDRTFAEDFVRSWLRRKAASALRLFAELRRRGIAPEIAHSTITRLLPESELLEQARRAAREKLRRLHHRDRQRQWSALAGYLSRQGFPAAIVRRLLPELFPDLRVG